jgi:uncharacterized protein YukE
VPGDFQVNPNELANGAKLIQGVSDQAQSLSNALTSTFASLVQAAGDNDLATALSTADGTCVARMLDVVAVLGHIGETLGDNARSYQSTESRNTATIKAAAPGSAR